MPFYKKQNEELLVSLFVDGQGYMLSEDGKGEYSYPIDGWSWFNNLDEAIVGMANSSAIGSITALQGLLAIDAAGLSSAYESWASSADRTFAEKAFINRAQIWKRDDVTLLSAAVTFGLTETQLDELFILGATL